MDAGADQHQAEAGKIVIHGDQHFADALDPTGLIVQKERRVRAHGKRRAGQAGGIRRLDCAPAEPEQQGGGVAAAAAKTGPQRNAFA